MANTDRIHVFETALGWIALRDRGPKLVQVAIGHRSEIDAIAALSTHAPKAEPGLPAEIAVVHGRLAKRLKRMADGQPQDFGDVQLDLTGMTPFQRATIAACREISWGETATYGELAAKVGAPGAARAVGQCMAGNRFPLIVPCHRVLGAGGRLGGFSAPRGVDLKRQLLRLERSTALAAV